MTSEEIYITLVLETQFEEFTNGHFETLHKNELQIENIIYRNSCEAFDIYVEVLGQELWVGCAHKQFFEWIHDGPWVEVIEDQLKKMRERQIKEPNKKKKGSSGEFVQFFRDYFIP